MGFSFCISARRCCPVALLRGNPDLALWPHQLPDYSSLGSISHPSLMSKCLPLVFGIRGRWRLKFFFGKKEQGTEKGFCGLEPHRDLLGFTFSVLDGFSTCFSTTVPGTIFCYTLG